MLRLYLCVGPVYITRVDFGVVAIFCFNIVSVLPIHVQGYLLLTILYGIVQ